MIRIEKEIEDSIRTNEEILDNIKSNVDLIFDEKTSWISKNQLVDSTSILLHELESNRNVLERCFECYKMHYEDFENV